MQIVRSDWLPAPRTLPETHTAAAIGDVHGMADHLAALQAALAEEFAQRSGPRTLAYLGDLVDRGPDSRRALQLMADGLAVRGVEEVHLRGNHDAWLIDLLRGRLDGLELLDWAGAGGDATLRDLGLDPKDWTGTFEELVEAARQALGTELCTVLYRMRLNRQVGPYLFVHAGIHPTRPIELQGENTLLWMREPFLETGAPLWVHEVAVVHGHTPWTTQIRPHRIGVDSGAPFTGVLSAVLLESDRLQYISAVSDDADRDALPPVDPGIAKPEPDS